MYIIPSSTPKSTSRGNEERNRPKLRLKGDDAWFMIFVSTSSKMNHKSTPSASLVSSEHPAVMSLSL